MAKQLLVDHSDQSGAPGHDIADHFYDQDG